MRQRVVHAVVRPRFVLVQRVRPRERAIAHIVRRGDNRSTRQCGAQQVAVVIVAQDRGLAQCIGHLADTIVNVILACISHAAAD